MAHFTEQNARKFGRALGRENDLKGLRWIFHFGWLRSTELGVLIWPEAAEPRKRGEHLTRKWLKRSLVIRRELPDGAGAAYVLAAAGAALLQEYGINANSGKNWGRIEAGEWTAPSSWRHDLMAFGLLAHLHARGFDILPENQLRRENSGLVKIPDGLAIVDKKVYWIELERARKTGDRMHDLADLIISVNEGQAPIVSGLRATFCIVAFEHAARDEKEHAISHSLRIRHALSERSSFDVQAIFLQLDLQAHTVVGFNQEQPSIVESANVSRLMAELAYRTVSSRSSLIMEYKVCRINDYLLRYRELSDTPEGEAWEWVMGYFGPSEKEFGKAKTLCRATAISEASCQRMLAMTYLARHQYYPFDRGIDDM